MKKYRYTDPKSPAGLRFAAGQFLKFFIGWNIFGYCIWSLLKTQQRKKDPEFDSKGRGEQLRSMMGINDKEQVKYRIKIGLDGISVKKKSPEDSDNTTGEVPNSVSDKQGTSDQSKADR